MTKCKELPLDDIVTMIDYRGKTPKKSTSGIPLITAKIIKNGRIYTPTEFISEDEYVERMTRGFPQIGDILITTEAPLGEVAELRDAHVAMGQRIITMHANKNLICGKYLKYYLLSHEGQSKLRQRESGTTVTGIKQAELRKVLIPLPPLYVQQRISRILDTLDDKIELNEKINQNLEAQAQAIFKSWFVDFEPFGGKMPKDWKISQLRMLCETITKGTTPTTLKRAFVKKGINFFKAESISSNHTIDLKRIMFIDDETNAILKRSQIKPFDILYTIAGTIGRFAIVMPSQIPANTNQAVAIIRCKSIYTFFVYSIFLYEKNLQYFNSKVVQAVQANLSLGSIGDLPVILPSHDVLDKYSTFITPIFSTILKNNKESYRLAELRDALLPKLMSGEIDVSDVAV